MGNRGVGDVEGTAEVGETVGAEVGVRYVGDVVRARDAGTRLGNV